MSSISHYFPWRISGTEMQPNILLMCKMLVVLLVFHGFFSMINDPFIPFIIWLDEFNNFPGVLKYSLRIGFFVFSVLILLNIRPKLSSLVLGFIIILTLVSSKSLFRNHIFIVGCILFLVGLSGNKGLPWLIIFQISLIYFGASINKALQIDWWTGQFMHNWLGTVRENIIYINISEALPTLWLAKILSWTAIFVEFIIAVTLLSNKWRKMGIWLIIVFHFTMFTLIGIRFGHFVEDVFIILMAFLVWPRKRIFLNYSGGKLSIYHKIIKILDWDNLFILQDISKHEIKEVDNKEIIRKDDGPIEYLFYTVGVYVFLMVFNFIMSYLVSSTDSNVKKMVIHFMFCFPIWIIMILFFKTSNTFQWKNYYERK